MATDETFAPVSHGIYGLMICRKRRKHDDIVVLGYIEVSSMAGEDDCPVDLSVMPY